MSHPTRRRFLHWSLATGAALTLPRCAAGPVRTTPNRAYLALAARPEPGHVALVVTAKKAWDSACAQAVERAGGLSWLRAGDSVFIKVASNSGYAHPAVTSPDAVGAMIRLLRSAGAGRIFVGDQAGAEHVRRWRDGRRSSTRERFADNGILAAIEACRAELHCFDDQPWESNIRAKPDFPNHWGEQLWLPSIVDTVDHIVVMPRLGAHALAGYSAGMKAAVGWLRDDSRLSLHRDADAFYQRIAEINHVPPLRNKVRLVVTVIDQALVTIGPDIGSTYTFPGCLALASSSVVDHDAVASMILWWLRDNAGFSVFDLYEPYPEQVDYWNRRFVEQAWGTTSRIRPLIAPQLGQHIAQDVMLTHLAALRGYRLDTIRIDRGEEPLPRALMAHLRSASEGVVAL